MKPKRLSRTVIYEDPWVNVYADRVQFPNGRVIDKHHLLEFESPSVVAVVENHLDQLLLVCVMHYTTGTETWELPAGGIETGESLVQAAQREVMEETGYTTIAHMRQHHAYHHP